MTTKKKPLIELIMEAGVKWPEGAEYAAQDKDDSNVYFYTSKPYRPTKSACWVADGVVPRGREKLQELCRNWHQTIVTKAQYENAMAERDSWIQWEGGECPVDERCIVEVKLCSGDRMIGCAGSFTWYHYGGSADIIAYRVIEQASEPEPEPNPEPECIAEVKSAGGIQITGDIKINGHIQIPGTTEQTFEQLAADYMAKLAEVERLRDEVEEANDIADAAWDALTIAAKRMGLAIGIAAPDYDEESQA